MQPTPRLFACSTLALFALWSLTACGEADTQTPSAATAPSAASTTSAEDLLGDWQPMFDAMAMALELTPTQRDQLAQAFVERERAMRAWLQGPEGQRLMQLEGELAQAAAARDLQRVRAITAEAGPLRRNFEALATSTEQQVLASLSPAHQQAWEAHQLAGRLLDLMQPLNLSDAQRQQVGQRAGDFLQQARDAREPNPPAAAFLAMERWAENAVLDDRQRAAYQEIKKANPLRSLRS